MQKELNPDLFGEMSTGQSRLVDNSQGLRGISGSLTTAEVDEKLAEMKNQIKQLLQNMSRFGGQVSEAIAKQQERVDQLTQSVIALEKGDQKTIQELSQKWSQLHSRISDRERSEQKILEMVDRHNAVLKSYELRLAQLQKLISEREEQITMTRAALNEARAEITRLKRL